LRPFSNVLWMCPSTDFVFLLDHIGGKPPIAPLFPWDYYFQRGAMGGFPPIAIQLIWLIKLICENCHKTSCWFLLLQKILCDHKHLIISKIILSRCFSNVYDPDHFLIIVIFNKDQSIVVQIKTLLLIMTESENIRQFLFNRSCGK
jgi:hypothetical protein